MSLSVLLRLQALFAAASITYLVASLIRQQTTGEPLSAAAIGPSIVMFIAYLGILVLPRMGRVGWYRIGMIPALLLFGGGGVIGNVVRYLDSGLAQYASVTAWSVAVGINAFGTVLNIIAALGFFRRAERSGSPTAHHERR